MQRVAHRPSRLVINLCTCGSLHFTYGPITLHLSQQDFLMLAEQIAQGANALKRQAEDLEMGSVSHPPHPTCH